MDKIKADIRVWARRYQRSTHCTDAQAERYRRGVERKLEQWQRYYRMAREASRGIK